MDSSFQPTTSAVSDDGEPSKTVLAERAKFLSTYIRDQPWSFPDSIIYYILKNPSNSKVYQKIIQSCKYFFIKNSLLVISDLSIEYLKNKWNFFLDGINVDLNHSSSKLWTTGEELLIYNNTPIPPISLPTILSKIYQNDAKALFIQYQKINITDLQLLASNCERIGLTKITVINKDDTVAGLEKIIEVLPKINGFCYYFSQNLGASQNVITPETIQKLIQLPHFSNLNYFYLHEIPEAFDIDTFYNSIIKKNKKTKIDLRFVRQLSQEYRNRLQTIVNEIISTHNHDYKVPYIIFSGNDSSSSNTLLKIFLRN